MEFFSPKSLETEAREWIQHVYFQANISLPDGWDDPDVLTSLGVDMAVLNLELQRNPEVHQLIHDSTPSNRN